MSNRVEKQITSARQNLTLGWTVLGLSVLAYGVTRWIWNGGSVFCFLGAVHGVGTIWVSSKRLRDLEVHQKRIERLAPKKDVYDAERTVMPEAAENETTPDRPASWG